MTANLIDIFSSLFSKQANLSTACKKKDGKSITINKNKEDWVFCIDMDKIKDWPYDKMRADCIFICQKSGEEQFLVVISELKGGNTEHAFKQIESSANILCKNSMLSVNIHGKIPEDTNVISYCHGKKVIGVILSTRAIPQEQVRKKKLLKKGIVLKRVTAKHKAFTLAELYSIMKT